MVIRRTQYSGFVEVFKCLAVLESNVGGNDYTTVRTVLKVSFEKAASPCPSDVPAPLNQLTTN